jgi:hypothetical protein
MAQNESVISKWAPALLLMELNNVLWRETNDIQIKKLWEYLCTYCYLPRLANVGVLEDAIRTGVDSMEYFAFAAGFDANRYIDLKFNQQIDNVEYSGYLVKTSIATKQLDEEAKQRQLQQPEQGNGDNSDEPVGNRVNITEKPSIPSESEQPQNKHFFMTAQLDNTRINRDVQRLIEEVISHLTSVDGVEAEISLEVNVTAPNGLSPSVVRTVSENCRTLKVQSFGFDK